MSPPVCKPFFFSSPLSNNARSVGICHRYALALSGPPGQAGATRALAPGRSGGYLPSQGGPTDASPALQAGRQPPPAPPRDLVRLRGAAPLTTGPSYDPPTSRAGLAVRATDRRSSLPTYTLGGRTRVGPDGLGAGAENRTGDAY